MNSSNKKLKISQSEFLLSRSSSVYASKSLVNDPFSNISIKVNKKPVLKPTYHKIAHSEKHLKICNKTSAQKNKEIDAMLSQLQITNKNMKSIAAQRPKAKQEPLSAKNPPFAIQNFNPSFSAKVSDRSDPGEIKPVIRAKVNSNLFKGQIKVPSLNRKMIQKVNSLFEGRSCKNKSALDFSFADRDSFIVNL